MFVCVCHLFCFVKKVFCCLAIKTGELSLVVWSFVCVFLFCFNFLKYHFNVLSFVWLYGDFLRSGDMITFSLIKLITFNRSAHFFLCDESKSKHTGKIEPLQDLKIEMHSIFFDKYFRISVWNRCDVNTSVWHIWSYFSVQIRSSTNKVT